MSSSNSNSARTDRTALMKLIMVQQRKVNRELDDLVKQKTTQSRYPAMSRQDRRITEYHWDRVVQEKALQKDLKKADRMVDRVAQVLEQVRKDFNKVKNHIGNYNFVNTTGSDSSAAGDCLSDLSQAIDTRAAWKSELVNILHMIRNYSNQQYLGDYAILHSQVPADGVVDATNCGNCCPLKYRSVFHYNTPLGDCLKIANEVSGDSSVKGSPESNRHNIVSNKDLQIEKLYCLLCQDPATSVNGEKCWYELIFKVVFDAITGCSAASGLPGAIVAAKAALEKQAGLSANVVDLLTSKPAAVTDALTFVEAVYNCVLTSSFEAANQINTTYDGFLISSIPAAGDLPEVPANSVFVGGTGPITPLVNPFYLGGVGKTTKLNTLYGWRYVLNSVTTGNALANIPTLSQVRHIEDESAAFEYVRDTVNCMMNEIRACQIKNDREQQTINYVRDVSECNQAYHEEVYGEMTLIDDGALTQRYQVGKEMLHDLDCLYKENCVTKQSFFKDVTLNGMSTW